MIALVSFSYSSFSQFNTMTPEEFNPIREKLIRALPQYKTQLEEDYKEPMADGNHRSIWIHGDSVIDLVEDGPILTELGVVFEVKSFKGTYKAVGVPVGGAVTNITIAFPGLGLLSISEVTNLDDACTRELQEHLAAGWRILAVCPPNGTRRPDYILGRSNGSL